MESVNIIKNELINQKNEIEKKYGTVNVANSYPSPSEITQGIATIPYVDLSQSTATEEDVLRGKTFYSGGAELRTGSADFDVDAIDMIFLPLNETVMTEKEFYLTLPSYLTNINRYKFYANSNTVRVTFNDSIAVIDEYAFYKTYNFKFYGFDDLTTLKTISSYAFAYSSCDGVNYGQLPHSVTTIGQNCFYYSNADNMDFRFPDSLSSVNNSLFMASTRVWQRSLDLSNFKFTKLSASCFYNNCFNCDIIFPDVIETIGTNCFYDGGFNNIIFGANLNKLDSYSFGGTVNHAVSNFNLKSIVFQTETPPTIGTRAFAVQNLENGLKIYVPDNAVEEYKAVSNLSQFVDVIVPMSQRP